MEENKIIPGDEVYVDIHGEDDQTVRLYMIVMDEVQDEHFFYGYAGVTDKILGFKKSAAVKTGRHFDSVPLDYVHEEA